MGAGPLPILPPHLHHFYVVSPERHCTDTLRRVVHALSIQRALVFMNQQRQLLNIKHKLEARNMEVGGVHVCVRVSARLFACCLTLFLSLFAVCTV